jgi:hypothetical protein
MKLWIAPYGVSRKLDGFLIKLQSQDFRAGYADCRPWPIFNDAPVEQHIQLLQNRKLNGLLKRSVFFAHIDGVAREEKRSLWPKHVRLRSHFTLLHLAQLSSNDFLQKIREQGFRTLKLKVGRDIAKEIPLCLRLAEKNWFRLRLDFNGVDAEPFLKKMSSLFLSQIDLIEDPGAYDEARWMQLENKYGIKTALDQAMGLDAKFGMDGKAHFAKIIKPARENQFARAQDVITNSLDHPVGQAFAALQAQHSVDRLGKQTRDYGLQSAHLFEANSYFSEMATNTAYFQAIPGTGIGFDEVLVREPWTEI